MRSSLLALLAVTMVGCFDPLFEDLESSSGVALCCRDVVGDIGTPWTCTHQGQQCLDEPECSLPAYACSRGGVCSTSACDFFGADSGAQYDAGVLSDAGVFDAGGTADAGTAPDAGGTDAGPTDAGVVSTTYEFCCVAGAVTTCACPTSGCGHQAFTPCLHGTCVSTGVCPSR